MLVQRLKMHLKPGTTGKAIEMLKEQQSILKAPHGMRIFSPYIAKQNELVSELDFENLAELEAYWTECFSSPEFLAFMDRWTELVISGADNEVWMLEE